MTEVLLHALTVRRPRPRYSVTWITQVGPGGICCFLPRFPYFIPQSPIKPPKSPNNA